MPAPPLDQMLAELIALPTVSSVSPDFDMGNRDLVDRVAGWLESAGFRVEVIPLTNFPNKANFIATLGTGEDGLILSGHTDTVPWDDGLWRHDPFKLTPDAGRLYGLGSADMKSFLALAIEAARGLDPAQLRHPLIIVGTADEESSMDGARLLTQLGRPRARHCVIGEPTDLKPVHMHKGIAMEAVRITGRSGHSSDPARGRNALDGMHRVLGALLDWREDLTRRYRNDAFAVPYPTLNLGHIHGGDNPNRICPSCEVHFDLRPLPGMSLDTLRSELHAQVDQALRGSELSFETFALFPGIEAFQSPPAARVVDLLAELSGKPPRSVAFGTEAPFYARLGIETVIFGPGSIDQAHQPNEFIEHAALAQTIAILRTLIRTLCIEA
ncbi:acetylornithine deacetylase [Acidihalobacter ferrooxydans]|uniref:Acetylornithine deacetylase n=1 Tax=Acidihalobacter ferrooxydans TaxID=1765967 RepID=A0A1P8UEQ6_9GAMM|nr:acetylornithine deacetylase [Acidihalobacter ferrooxydans]APZ42289.1 acetylornithine deacetylase [Acidihalobacter ferrooxydans]